MKTPKIQDMLIYRRPAWSNTEERFIGKYIDTIPGVICDAFGNRIVITDETSATIISVHTDTVHRADGFQRIHQNKNIVALHRKEKVSNCLGADDTAGVYVALRMIQAGVKAAFIFHRAEEIGGKGSTWLAENYAGWLGKYKRCIALDRRGTSDVITHQMWERTASETFCTALCQALGMSHKPTDGVFTDSANYATLIPECSNVSVGYQSEHTIAETLDLDYLEHLIEALIRIDYEALPSVRDPNEYEPFEWDNWRDRWSITCTATKKGSSGITLDDLCEWCGLESATCEHDSYLLCDVCAAELKLEGIVSKDSLVRLDPIETAYED